MQYELLEEGTPVIVHSLGEKTPGEYRAIIRGVCDIWIDYCNYIVEEVDKWQTEGYPVSPYSCHVITSHCVKLADKEF